MGTIYDIAANVPRPQEGPVGALQRARNEKAVRRLNEAQSILMETQAERYNEFKDRELKNQSVRNTIDAATLEQQIDEMYLKYGPGSEGDNRQLKLFEETWLTGRELYESLKGKVGDEAAKDMAGQYIRRFNEKLDKPWQAQGYSPELGEAMFQKNEKARVRGAIPNQALNELGQMFPDSVQREAQTTARNAASQGREVGHVTDVISQALQGGLNPDILLATPGAILGTVSAIKSGVTAGMSYAGSLFDEATGTATFSGDATTKQGQDQLLSNPRIAASAKNIQVPEGIKGDVLREQYRSAVIALAWATWRAMEGSGSRASSDLDFARALDRIGGAAGNSRAMLNTIMAMMKESTAGFDDYVAQVEGTVKGVKPQYATVDQARAYMFGGLEESARTSLKEAQTKIDTLLGNLNGAGGGGDGSLAVLQKAILDGSATREQMDEYEKLTKGNK